MKHLILGAGDLGLALARQIEAQGEEYVILSKSRGWEWPINRRDLELELEKRYDFVWCTVGAGSIEEGKKFWGYQLLVHVDLPRFVVDTAPNSSKCIFFSSDYVNPGGIPYGKYGLGKQLMEASLFHSQKNNFRIVRVSNLTTEKSGVIYKIKNALAHKIARLNHNELRPTDCDSLATHLHNVYVKWNEEREVLYIAGKVTTPVSIAARELINNADQYHGAEIILCGYDPLRPRKAMIPDYEI